MKIKRKIRRVDVQVSILIILTTVFCSVCIYLIAYRLTYHDMIKSLQDRVNAIYTYLDDMLDKSTFQTINSKSDMKNENYLKGKEILTNIKNSTNVRYLYTAKKTDTGKLIYIIDGLEYDAEDFRFPGDKIEEEICPDMERALKDSVVLPDEIKSTDWGEIFIAYFPIHDKGEVAGVLGIEFEASHQYSTYLRLKQLLPAVIIFTCLASTLCAVIIFRKISNPSYKDSANTDFLTDLRNSNAFHTDLNNLESIRSKVRIGIIEADLNNLKTVNDKLGHNAGDTYIKAAAQTFERIVGKQGKVYRVGGDEFTAVITNTDKDILQALTLKLQDSITENSKSIIPDPDIKLSLSVGFAIYDPQIDSDLRDLCVRADKEMYKSKKAFHNNL